MIELGIINGWSEDCFAYVQKKGLKCVEFCVNHNYDSDAFLASVPDIRKYSEQYGVRVGSCGRWGQRLLNDDGSVIEKTFRDYCNVIDAASALGCPVFNCGCNAAAQKSFAENCAIAIEVLRKLVAYGRERGVKVAVYNCSWENFVFNDAAWSVVLPAVEGLGIKYDTSHCIGRGDDWMAEMEKWGKYFYHVHLKGSMYIGGRHYDDPPAGLDTTNWGAFFNLLYTQNYSGMLSIEPHSSRWQGAMGQWGVDFTIRFVQPYLMPAEYEQEGAQNPYMP